MVAMESHRDYVDSKDEMIQKIKDFHDIDYTVSPKKSCDPIFRKDEIEKQDRLELRAKMEDIIKSYVIN